MAVELALILDDRRDRERAEREIKAALISHDPEKWLPVLYPQSRSESPDHQQEGVDGDVDPDTIGDDKVVFTEEVTPEEVDRMLAEASIPRQGVLSLGDVDSEGWFG